MESPLKRAVRALAWTLMVAAVALTCADNFRLRQETAGLVEQLKAIERPTGQVNCPSLDWFTGRSDVQ